MTRDRRPSSSGSGTRERPGRVLIIDDDKLVGEAMRLVLSDGNDVVTETDAEWALARLERGERYDLVLCDLMMPGMNGMDFHDRLNATMPDEARRLVFITGGVFLPRVAAFLDALPNLCLEKPPDFAGLRALIERRKRGDVDDVASPKRAGASE